MLRLVKKSVFFALIILLIVASTNDIIVSKIDNRYYILSKELENIEDIDVQIYGSCHAYTSFNSKYFTEITGLSSYNMAAPSEIIPSTYLRMYERFKTDIPEVVVVELWGVNAYDTYIESEKIMEEYFQNNIGIANLSIEKLKIINDFESLSVIEENIPIVKYRARLLDGSINALDFEYNIKQTVEQSQYAWLAYEMNSRLNNQGYLLYEMPARELAFIDKSNKNVDLKPLQIELEDDAETVSDTFEIVQNEVVEITENLADEVVVSKTAEENLMKYLNKIIDLCEENNVQLIFYRAPYDYNEVEYQKNIYLTEYLAEKNIPYYDLEREIKFDYLNDFYDENHLCEPGALKVTKFLTEKIQGQLFK